MKNILFLFLSLSSFFLFAQAEHRVSVGNKTIEFREIDRLVIVGHDEKDLKITRKGGDSREDERAKGMRKISASGKTDNTGFGISSQGFDDKVVIDQVGKGDGTIMVFVPNSSVVKVVQSTYRGGDLEVNNFKGELDVSMHYHKVKLTNTYGPLAINTIYGGIEAAFSSGPPSQDIRLHSTYGNVELMLPKNTAANLRLSTSYGSMYTDFDIDVKANMANAEGQKGSDHDHDHGGLTGTINGGGKLVSLNATYKNIYLRKLE
ncbi:DUF4097 family beta strand repeat-containing protein [Neolewinella persica]|uniref:DUF4097 family beta strand repeat-containing protein n=1 Tax=Neolewinella persica TaxID=70998 RepID=UPI0003613D72|nr:DUF4097 family beta strand repeat-containing protein [Neolewinella persica]